LADADMRLEASFMVRAMAEFLIRQHWLESDPRRNHLLWARNDLEARLRIDRELREIVPAAHNEAIELMTPEVRRDYEQALARMREQVEEAHAELSGAAGARPPVYPNLRAQAQATDHEVVYSLAYRSDSLLNHPTPYAIEQLFEAHANGVRVRADPPPARGYADPYSVAAFLLRDALASAAAQRPELILEGFDATAARLDALATSAAAGGGETP
jgi:hypothetical protein